jgi:mono/diheme cytochrome c family protein
MRNVYIVTLFVVVALVSVLGFRGTKFTAPPLDVFPEWAFPGMKYQPKYQPQGSSAFFADGRADRAPVANTVARGMLRDDDALYLGKDGAGAFVRGFPAALKVDVKFIERGRDRYGIYCQPCHGALGDGNGVTKRYGMGATPSYHDDRLRTMAEGELYNTITNGKNTMLPYADKLAPEDRWAVVSYVRALQRAQQGKPGDVVDAAARKSLGLQ